MTEVAAVRQIILTTRGEVQAFLASHPDPDETITWTCPVCLAVNVGAYHSHAACCGACGRWSFPRIPLPIEGDVRTSVKRAALEEQIGELKKRIERTNFDIYSMQDQIADLEKSIWDSEAERDRLEQLLHKDKVETGDA